MTKFWKLIIVLLTLTITITLGGCNKATVLELAQADNPNNQVYYQIFVRSFADSDDDGVGDFNGVTAKLQYLKDLGVSGIWLMPITNADTYHGYDVTDYYGVNPDYGTMEDFENLVVEAEKLGIKVMVDMVFNHTSNNHPWFKAAVEGDSKYHDYYVFAPSGHSVACLLGEDGQGIWHTTTKSERYCGNFSFTMPDLNMYSDEVYQEIINISRFWIEKGVSGFRLDACKYFYGTNEYVDKIYDFNDNVYFLLKLRNDIRKIDPDFYLLGEVYETSMYNIIGEYFRGLDSPLDFPVSEKIMGTVGSVQSSGYINNLWFYYNAYRAVDKSFISAPFLRNHDMDRVASVLGNNANQIRLAAEMCLTLPGTPIIYYGEEIGMLGTKSNGQYQDLTDVWDETRRLPFKWGDEYDTTWFDNSINSSVASVKDQVADEQSIYNVYKRLLQIRNENLALRFGNSFETYENNTAYLQGFYREYTYGDTTQKVLVVHNLNPSPQDFTPNGKVLYLSGTDDYSSITQIPGKSTIIIDVTN